MTPDEQLAHEEQVAKILAIRSPAKSPSRWDSSALTATLSTIAGAIIAFTGSYLLKDRELETERVEAQVERIRKAAFDANDALASMLKANEERFLFATGAFGGIDSVQRIAMARATNTAQQTWRVQRENAEMGLILAFDADSTVDTDWSAARDAVEHLTTCMETAYRKYLRVVGPKTICQAERDQSRGSVGTFRSRLRTEYKRALAKFP